MDMNKEGIPEQTVQVDKWNINYIVVGNGPHVVFCMPGTLGTIWDNFELQIAAFDREKFTVVVWDPPGQGKSLPPEREFNERFYFEDADHAVEFMRKIGYPRFSILGWCGGGRTGIIMAGKYQEAVRSLVVWGTNTFFTPDEMAKFGKTKHISKWPERARAPLVAIYGEERFQRYWSQWMESIKQIFAKGGDICTEYLEKIECPTFILYGQRDPLVHASQAPFMHERIKGSKLYIDPGSHDFHRTRPEDFNKRVQEWLLEH